MILNDGQVEIVRKHYITLDILTEAQRSKGRETGIKGTGERILHRPYSHPKLFGTRSFEKKKKKKKNITYLYQGSCLHILEAGNGLFAFK